MCLMVGLTGYALTSLDQALLSNPLVTGVILFNRNYQNPQQLQALTQAIKTERPDVVIAIDQEGGRIQRLSGDPFTTLPSFRQLGHYALLDKAAALHLAYSVGYVMAYELHQHQIDFSCTPVLDRDHGLSAVIGDRSFHSDPNMIIELAGALCQGIHAMGMITVGKHFPGHGGVVADTHFRQAIDLRNKTELEQDIKPFEALIKSGLLSAIMPAHVIYEQVDSEPAGFSAYWLQHILRETLHFKGWVFSDCLTMQAAQMEGGLSAAAMKSLAAGCDVVLICNQLEKIPAVLIDLMKQNISPRSCDLPLMALSNPSTYTDHRQQVMAFTRHPYFANNL